MHHATGVKLLLRKLYDAPSRASFLLLLAACGPRRWAMARKVAMFVMFVMFVLAVGGWL